MNLQKELRIDKCHALVLDKRFNDWQNKKDQLKKIGLEIKDFIVGDGKCPYLKYNRIDTNDFPPKYSNSINYATWYKYNNAYNAFLSHQQMIKEASKEGVQTLLLLEDDIVLNKNYQEIVKDIVKHINYVNYDLLCLGGFYQLYNLFQILPSKYLYRTIGNGGFHAIVIRQTLFDFYINHLPTGPMDWITEEKIQKNYANYFCVAVHPSLILQESNYSYVEHSYLNREEDLTGF